MQRICKITGKSFDVSDWELALLNKFLYAIPTPTLSIEERHRRRLSYRNERKIYKDICALTGKPMVSVYSPDKPFKVYSQEAWWSDQWDSKSYGRDFDFNRPFFEQFRELQLAVPHIGLINVNGENSEFCNVTTGNKNCYLVFGGDYSQDSLYSVFSMKGVDNVDCYWCTSCELMYDCVDCHSSYSLRYSRGSVSCRNSAFLYECRNCEDCFGCVGLINKKHHIFNKPYSPEEYQRIVSQYDLLSWKSVQYLKSEFEKFRLQFPHRYARMVNAENCTGDFVTNAKNCQNCFGIDGPAEDCKDIFFGGWGIHDVLSCDHAGYKAELYYEMVGSIEGSRCAFCTFSWSSQDTYYCDMVVHSSNLFGCCNMKRAQYCILNKQYSKEEYETLVPRIVEHMKKTGEWGEFFPIQNSKFAYNETVAQDYYPLTKEEALAQGYQWLNEEKHDLANAPFIPDALSAVTDSILDSALVCEKTGRPYRIILQELAFYRKMGVPIPHYAPETRNEMRIALRNPIQTWERNCVRCGKSIHTSYAPEQPEIVYCEECYLGVVY
ncbi:hypothetical protein IPG41_05930 [Candidatus Peregrinibacteria bacterium]|nr:MAG: hypothetical protein IPG41_05930 [Candidatus Peregrinibacteria bacterium]